MLHTVPRTHVPGKKIIWRQGKVKYQQYQYHFTKMKF
jgi:hypothetical protein